MLGACNTCVRLQSRATSSGITVNSYMFLFVCLFVFGIVVFSYLVCLLYFILLFYLILFILLFFVFVVVLVCLFPGFLLCLLCVSLFL